MSQVETFDRLSLLVVGRSHDLSANVQGRHGYKSDVELQRHGEVGSHVAFEIILVMGEPTQIFSVVPYCLPELFGVFDGF